MPTRAQLEKLIKQCDTETAALEKAIAEIAEQKRQLVDILNTSTLTDVLMPVKVNVNTVTDEHRMNIAKGQKPDDLAFAKVLAGKEFTQKRLAGQLRITPALLSMYRTGKRPIPRDRAAKVEELTGWKATPRNWPGGIVS